MYKFKFKASSDQEVVREDVQNIENSAIEASGGATGDVSSVDSSPEDNTTPELADLLGSLELAALFPGSPNSFHDLKALATEDKTVREQRRTASNHSTEDEDAKEEKRYRRHVVNFGPEDRFSFLRVRADRPWYKEVWRIFRLSCACVYDPENNGREDLTVEFLEKEDNLRIRKQEEAAAERNQEAEEEEEALKGKDHFFALLVSKS